MNDTFFNKLVQLNAIAAIRNLMWPYCSMLFERENYELAPWESFTVQEIRHAVAGGMLAWHSVLLLNIK